MTAALAVAAADSLSPPAGFLPWFAVTLVLLGASIGLFVMAMMRRQHRRSLLVGAGVLVVLALGAFCRFVDVAWSPPAAMYVVLVLALVLAITAAVISGLRLPWDRKAWDHDA